MNLKKIWPIAGNSDRDAGMLGIGNSYRTDCHGQTTEMQRSQWAHSLRYVPRDRSIVDKVRESPVTFFISLGLLCSLLVAMGLLAIGVIQ